MTLVRVTGNVWHITTEEEFWETCDCARSAVYFAETQATPDARWHFVECYANWVEQRFSVIFDGDAPPAQPRLLALQITLAPDGGYTITPRRPSS